MYFKRFFSYNLPVVCGIPLRDKRETILNFTLI